MERTFGSSSIRQNSNNEKVFHSAQLFLRILYDKRIQWASRWTWQHLTLGAHSTQRSESIHSTIKQFLNAHTLLTHLANKIDENRKSLSEQNEGRATRVDAIFNVGEGKIYEVNSIVRDSVEREGLSGGTNKEKLTSMDLGLSKVFTKSSRKTTLTSCTCLFPSSWGLPCRHMLIVHHHEKITNIHDKAIVDFWKIENQADHNSNIYSCIGSQNVIELQENDQNNPILTKDERIPVFTMPQKPDELSHACLLALHRDDMDKLNLVYLRSQHFREPFKGRDGAVPTILSGGPSCYSSHSSAQTRPSCLEDKGDEIHNKAGSLSLESGVEEKEKIKIQFQNLQVKLHSHLSLKTDLFSQTAYHHFQSMSCTSLPHSNTLQKLYSSFRLQIEFFTCLKQSTRSFSSEQRNVIIQTDEFRVKSDISYKGGRFFASNLDTHNPTNIMLYIWYKKWSCIVRLLACTSLSAEKLFETNILYSCLRRL
ncbi:hypothetical protein LOD99_15896 [Oopsacas minuta]|uniref:SWIM-type domain-containing protein n=1 Tax=Oopsacas minuta TaxID=111878 RepID=A0AAV7K822_9METZ|nr:hypothetical protein LOD99_15896 [Oopsacas minuta]